MTSYTLSMEENKKFESVDNEFNNFIRRIQNASIINVDRIRDAYEIAKYFHRNQTRKSGEYYIYHPLYVCMKMYDEGIFDVDALCAALLHDTLEDTEYSREDLLNDFGKYVYEYVDAVTKFEPDKSMATWRTIKVSEEKTHDHLLSKTERYRFACYIKFADRWHNLHTCTQMSKESITKNVKETKSFLIPLAREIGCNLMAEQLLDACFLALDPQQYWNISSLLNRFRINSHKGINKVLSTIRTTFGDFATLSQEFEVQYPYMVAKEIRNKFKNANLLRSDLFSFYEYKPYAMVVCKINHRIAEQSLESQFLQAISPLLNKIEYQSETKNRFVTSAQIAYVNIIDSTYHNKIRFLLCAEEDYMKYCNGIAFGNGSIDAGKLAPEKNVRINTKDGEHRYISKDATVLDFAFMLHPEIGLHFKSAIVNGKQVHIDYVFQNDDTVIIETSEEIQATIDWLRIVTTPKAKDILIEYIKNSN